MNVQHSLFWCVTVNNVKSISTTRITINGIFRDRVSNLIAVTVNRELIKLIRPPTTRRNSFRRHLITISQQSHRDACRSLSILVLIIIPSLCTAYFCRLRCMLICDIVVLYCSFITIYRLLVNCVFNFLTIFVFWKICETVFPVSALICSNILTLYLFSVSQQIYRNHRWAFAVLVIVVIPGLCTAYCRCFWCMRICNDKIMLLLTSTYCCRIFIQDIDFLYCIGNLFRFLILLIEIAPCMSPSVFV